MLHTNIEHSDMSRLAKQDKEEEEAKNLKWHILFIGIEQIR